jgi:hypothetical protein
VKASVVVEASSCIIFLPLSVACGIEHCTP